jgi:hypothetical protein
VVPGFGQSKDRQLIAEGPDMTARRATINTCIILGCLLGGRVFAEAPAERVYDLVTDKNVDEQLYLVRRLEMLHSIFSSTESNADQLAADLFATRFEMTRIEEYARAKSMDDRLIQLYGDSIKLVDQYANVLMDSGWKRKLETSSNI